MRKLNFMVQATSVRNMILGLHTGIVYAFIYVPIIILIIFSFNSERISAVWTGFTTDWYIRVFNDADLIQSLINSLVIGLVSTLIATIIGTMVALGMNKKKFWGKSAFEGLLYLPIVIPEIVMAVSLLAFYVFVSLPLGTVSVILAHVTFNISFVYVVVRARLAGTGDMLEKAAADLGATPWQTFRYVTLPMILPGVIAGALLAFTISWDDFLIAFFTSGVGGTTLPMKVYSMIKFGVSPEINAISTITIFVSMLLILIAVRIEGVNKTTDIMGK